MNIDEKTVDQIAALARLRFSEEEKSAFARQFSEIVAFVEQLSEVDTTAVGDADESEQTPLAEDEVQSGFSREEALHNAPEADDDYFLVPKVIAEVEE